MLTWCIACPSNNSIRPVDKRYKRKYKKMQNEKRNKNGFLSWKPFCIIFLGTRWFWDSGAGRSDKYEKHAQPIARLDATRSARKAELQNNGAAVLAPVWRIGKSVTT